LNSSAYLAALGSTNWTIINILCIFLWRKSQYWLDWIGLDWRELLL